MPLQKTNLGSRTIRCPEDREQIHRTPTPKCDPTKLHSNSIEITLRHGNHSANSPLTSSKKTQEGQLLKRESYL